MKAVNDKKIYKNKYYPWYYTDELEVNLVPISYYDKQQARYTLQMQFGKEEMARLFIIKGSEAISKGWRLGKNSYWTLAGKRHQVKKYYIPPEHNHNRSRRRFYINNVVNSVKVKNKSGVTKILKKYNLKTYGAERIEQ